MKIFETQIAGRPFRVEIGQVAQLAKGAAMIRYGETEVLVVTAASKKPREGMDFFPLSCDYEEKQYSVGKIPGGFIKREGRPTERAILNSRLMDRPLRPLFPKGFRNDVSVTATVMSVDQDNAPEIAAMIGSSIVLSISDIPFNGPTGAVAVGYVDGELIINPNEEQRGKSDLSLVVSGTKEAIMMVEAGANIVSEKLMLDAILLAHEEIKKIVAFQEEIIATVGKEKKEYKLFLPSEDVQNEIASFIGDRLKDAVNTSDKLERLENIDKVNELIKAHCEELFPEKGNEVDDVLKSLLKKEIRRLILEERIRPDNRKTNEIRPISAQIDFLARPHGSGLFTRGETQVLSVTTLSVLGDAQSLDGISNEESKRYMHHYNFPSYSVGETRPSRGPGRREIGHGSLAERALLPVLPSEEDFPYAIRVVSEVLSSNGSTSQGSVCGSSLSLMAAGVPIKATVAGIAMGLIKEGDKLAILSDIQGMEDALGDMDFKVAGTADGITAIQMDIKVDGISEEVLTEALEQARIGRLHIMGIMNEEISEPRKELSPNAPQIFIMQINPDKIRDVIGSGGKVINKIIDETGVKIDIEDDGRVFIASTDSESGKRAREIIENIVRVVEIGEVLTGKVVRIMTFGAFVSLPGGKDGLIHISKLANERVDKVEDVVNIGDEVTVKVMEIDGQGRINLSRKAMLPKE
ncbi:polyribonucleotide nucleotidyltransferase [Acetobacterium tundrae]|uniref:Polyribonucleotide nucleotidyltransferase n=2 Tax=Acetobacterium tundrae TaxID=132932 RepID=A0ABR6WK79_9FIRM|nr:polyribonucleotide nucleotidyltransferase [Acetobacterium tundrae]MBC3796527.1 polyribonucleotide nucleotidyltransferase [Acetobacterium tundrae]